MLWLIVRITIVLGDCPNHCSEIILLGYMWFVLTYSWETFYLDLATRLILHLAASSGTTSVRCTCRCISYRWYDYCILNSSGNSFLDPSTTCLRHLLPGSGTKWAHFTLRWMCLFYQPLRSDCWLELLLSKGHLHFFLEIHVATLDKERNIFLFSL